jgi:hypothetical protein
MFLSKLKLKNFRKYKNLEVPFKEGLNVLIGENDSGKTTIIDAIRVLLGTQSHEYYYMDEKDFNNPNEEMEIECTFSFKDGSDSKVAKFLEWITFNDEKKPELIVRLKAIKKELKIKRTITAGEIDLDTRFDLLDELRVTYLKPLRDANNELIAGRSSRLSQILKSHELFYKKENEHPFIEFAKEFNEDINKYFSDDEGKLILSNINKHLGEFLGKEKKEDYETNINITEDKLDTILNSLNLSLSKNKLGLGTLNQLYMSLELLLFEIDKNTLNLCLIEELEVHLHPQAQLRTIKHLQNNFEKNSQIILTTHSVNLASSLKLENLILCKNKNVYPLGKDYTQLEEENYIFLEMFLDATKANLFFAKGVIFVEGSAENLLVPAIAEIIEKPLDKYGVSIVNVSSTAFNNYSKIFLRKNKNESMEIPVAIITDLDVKDNSETKVIKLTEERIKEIEDDFNYDKGTFIHLKDKYYLNVDDLKKDIRKIKNLKKLRDGLGERIENFSKEEIDIIEYRNLIKERKKEDYENGNIKVFINKCQTLEYDLTMGELAYYLYNAILLTKNKKGMTKDEFKEYFRDKSEEEKVKEIFIDNFYINYDQNKKNKLSKAEVALNLSYLLKEDKENTKEILLKDEYCKYIVEAIEYTTGNIHIEGSNKND